MGRTLPTSIKTLCVFLLAAAATAGCVSQEKFTAQQLRANQLADQLGAAQSQLSAVTAEKEILRNQLGLIRNSGDNRDALLVNQANTIADLQRQLEELNGRYTQAMQNIGKAGAGALPVQLTNALTEFAAQNPDLVDFDSARGLVKFKSDVTFSPGSAEVRPEAKSAIDRLASILTSAAAAPYDLMVVGHTDSQPVNNPATIKAGHLDNWYLSAHRAIGVSKALQRQGVNAGRIEVAGYADQRPVDPSPTKEAMAKNRRVEVLILPTRASTASAGASGGARPAGAGDAGATPASARAAANSTLNKDSGPNNSRPAEPEQKPYYSK